MTEITSSASSSPSPAPRFALDFDIRSMDPRSPAALYAANCARRGVHVNAGVLRSLREICTVCVLEQLTNLGVDSGHGHYTTPEELQVVRRLDLSRNLVGREGVLAIIDLTHQTPVFDSLDLSNNFLDSAAIVKVAQALDGASHIRSVNLSGNPISQLGGRALFQLVASNPNIQMLGLEKTNLSDALVAKINDKVAQNRAMPAEDRAALIHRSAVIAAERKTQLLRRAEHVVTSDGAAAPSKPTLANTGAADADDIAALVASRPLSVIFAAMREASSGTETGRAQHGSFSGLQLLRSAYVDVDGNDDLGSSSDAASSSQSPSKSMPDLNVH